MVIITISLFASSSLVLTIMVPCSGTTWLNTRRNDRRNLFFSFSVVPRGCLLCVLVLLSSCGWTPASAASLSIPIWLLVVIVVGAVLLAVGISVLIAYCCCCRKKSEKKHSEQFRASLAPNDPNQLVTLVSVDIGLVDFMWNSYPDGMPRAIESVHAVVRECAKKWNGYEVKTVRERTLIAFPTPILAIYMAIDIQRRAQKYRWKDINFDKMYTEVEGLAIEKGKLSVEHSSTSMPQRQYVRCWNGPRLVVGIDSGIVERSEVWFSKNRFEYKGDICERACACEQAAGWGEIFVTENTYRAADGENVADVEFAKVGEIRLLKQGSRDTIYRVHCITGRQVLTLKEREALRSLDNQRNRNGVAYYDDTPRASQKGSVRKKSTAGSIPPEKSKRRLVTPVDPSNRITKLKEERLEHHHSSPLPEQVEQSHSQPQRTAKSMELSTVEMASMSSKGKTKTDRLSSMEERVVSPLFTRFPDNAPLKKPPPPPPPPIPPPPMPQSPTKQHATQASSLPTAPAPPPRLLPQGFLGSSTIPRAPPARPGAPEQNPLKPCRKTEVDTCSPEPTFWNGVPSVSFDRAYRCFKEGNGLLFRLVNDTTEEWSYYNDSIYYTMTAIVELGKKSHFITLNGVDIVFNPEKQQYEGRVVVPPLTTIPLLKGRIKGFNLSYTADAI